MRKHPFFDGNLPMSNAGSDNAVMLTPEMFFGGNNWSPYFTPDEWMSYGTSLRLSEVQDLQKMISLMSAGFRMEGSSQVKVDQGKREYVYDHFIQAKARPGIKVILDGGIRQFIDDYQQGRILVSFTLDDLLAEARKQLA